MGSLSPCPSCMMIRITTKWRTLSPTVESKMWALPLSSRPVSMDSMLYQVYLFSDATLLSPKYDLFVTKELNTKFFDYALWSGVGILSTPYALSSGGWLSLVLLLVIATATFYTGLLLRRCMDAHPNIRTYPDVGERAFGKMGRLLVSVFMYTELYLVATGFLILEGDNLHNLFPNMGLEIWGLMIDGRQSFIIIVGLVILPSVWVNNLNILSYISASGVLACIIILGSILWTGAFDGVGFDEKGTSLNWQGIPTAVSLYAFCYCAHPVFPTLYTSMRKKHQFSNVSFKSLIIFYMSNFSVMRR